MLLRVIYNSTAFPLYGSTVESLSRRHGLTIKLSSDRAKFHQKSVIDFFYTSDDFLTLSKVECSPEDRVSIVLVPFG